MGKRETVGSSLAGTKNWATVVLDDRHRDEMAGYIRDAAGPLEAQTLARKLGESLTEDAPAPATTMMVKKYDHRCDFTEGERVFVDNRYGKSFAVVTQIVRQPPTAFCDKAFLEFEDAEYRAKWEEERSTPYFAINSGRLKVDPSYVEGGAPPTASRKSRMNATAVAKLARVVEASLAQDVRFVQTPLGWHLADLIKDMPVRPHISAEIGGPGATPLPQGLYKAPLLEVIDQMGEATIDEIKRNIQNKLRLGPADWETDPTGKIVWIHRLHAAIKHLKRVGTIETPRRQVYRRATVQREKSA
jgi:hypothetical protein